MRKLEHLVSTQVGSALIVREFQAALPSIDDDKDNKLNIEELKKIAAMLDIQGINGDFITEYFELAHGGKGNTVNQQEALTFLTNGQSGIPSFSKDFDKDKSKTLSETEGLALAAKLKFDADKFKAAFAKGTKNGQLTPLQLRETLNDYTKSVRTAPKN